jgi:quinol monooxygenase YgiN
MNHPHDEQERAVVLATTRYEDFERFKEVFSGAGAEKRREHGCRGAMMFRDPYVDDRIWAVFDWDEAGWQAFVSDPEVPPIMKDAGHLEKPRSAALAFSCDS